MWLHWLVLRRGLRSEKTIEAFAILQENQNPQNAGHQRWSGGACGEGYVEREDVIELRRK